MSGKTSTSLKANSRRRRVRRLVLGMMIVTVVSMAGWIIWTEINPDQERILRLSLQEKLEQWFPEEMSWPDGEVGLIPHDSDSTDGRLHVVLVHGLDEPGGIWDDLIPALQAAGAGVTEFRYPNDQAIDASADLLAEHWPELDSNDAIVLIGHSMGGLVIRDFVTRGLPAEGLSPGVEHADVRGVILVGTPNHGSEWARFRIFLGVRDLLARTSQQDFSLFSALREGTGAAKIDLRPGSEFLIDLNARTWPDSVPIRLVGGRISEPTAGMRDNLEAAAARFGATELADAFEEWWLEIGDGLGDGVVSIASLTLPDAPAPIVVSASHRGMLVRGVVNSDDEDPPAIAVILEILEEWRGD